MTIEQRLRILEKRIGIKENNSELERSFGGFK